MLINTTELQMRTFRCSRSQRVIEGFEESCVIEQEESKTMLTICIGHRLWLSERVFIEGVCQNAPLEARNLPAFAFVMLSANPHAVHSNARQYNRLVAELGKLRSGLLVDLGVLLRIRKLSPCSLLPLVVCGTLDLSPLLEPV